MNKKMLRGLFASKSVNAGLAVILVLAMALGGCTKNTGNVEPESTAGETSEAEDRQSLEVIPEDAVYKDASRSVEERVEDLMSYMTLEEKAAQMVMAERNVSSGGVAPTDFKRYPLGCVLSGGGSAPLSGNTSEAWAGMINNYQKAAVEDTRLGIPILYGVDAVHGNSNVYGVTIFPHNVALGATGDLELVKEIGNYTAMDVRATGANWIFAPTLGNPQNVTWGRSYECFSEKAEVVSQFASACVEGLQGTLSTDEYLSQSKALATAKHFIGEGYTKNGVNQGNVDMSDEEFDALLESGVIAPYRAAVESGVKTVMISYNSVNGVKCHGNKHLVTDILRGELGFDGIVIGDYNAIQQIATEHNTFNEQLLAAIDAGIDVTMEPFMWREITNAIVGFVNDGLVSEERVNESVRRILTAKFELGLFENPYSIEEYIPNVGSDESREVARRAVRESLVLLKNDKVNDEETVMQALSGYDNIFIAGVGANDMGTQCGGWTISWQGQKGNCTVGTTIIDGINNAIGDTTELSYSKDGSGMPDEADAAIVVISEPPYAEMYGDTGYNDLSFTAREWGVVDTVLEQSNGRPVIAVLITGRTLTIADYVDKLDAIVCAWLPGTEGEGIADVLFGDYDFTGKLEYTWFWHGQDIKNRNMDNVLFDYGYGLTKAETIDLGEAPEIEAIPSKLDFDEKPEAKDLITIEGNGGKIEAEAYYYAEGCDKDFTSDVGGGMALINIDSGALCAYYVSFDEEKDYSFTWRAAAPATVENAVSLYIDGELTDTVTFESTGSYGTFGLTNRTVHVTEGEHIIVIQVNNDGFDLNRIAVKK